MKRKKKDKKLSRWRKRIQQRKRRNNRKYIMEKPRFKKIFMKYIVIGMCIALMLCMIGSSIAVSYYRKLKLTDAYLTEEVMISDISATYNQIMNYPDTDDEKNELWKTGIRWRFNSLCNRDNYAIALYDANTKEILIDCHESIAIILIADKDTENKRSYIYECSTEIMQSVMQDFDDKYMEIDPDLDGFYTSSVWYGLNIKDIYVKGGEFIPGKIELLQGRNTTENMDVESEYIIIKEYDYTPINTEEYKHIVIEGDESKHIFGPIMWNHYEERKEVKSLLQEYVEVSDEKEDIWDYANSFSCEESYMWGGQYVTSDRIELGEGLEVKLIITTQFNLLKEYGVWIALIYVLVLLLTLIISFAISYRNYMLRLNHYQLDSYRRETTNAMAHDLKTPLMAISGYAENLRANVHSEKKDYYADTILEHVKYMNEMVGNILELAKVENVEWVLEKEDVNLKSITEDILKKYEILTMDKKLRVAIEGESVIQADNSLMKQAIENLIGNAMKYAAEDTEIQIKIAEGVYEIRNTIDGALDTSVDELWKPFVKGDNSRTDQKGTGIGLTIVKNIAEAHGFELLLQCEEQEFVAKIGF